MNAITRYLAVFLLAIGTASTALAQDTKRVLAFGDSLTWGWMPVEGVTPTTRYPQEQRWTGHMGQALGDGYEIVEEGLSGRTTNVDDPTDERLNGAEYLPAALGSHEPLDLVIIMLGTNDTKSYLDRSPFEISLGAGELIDIVQRSDAKEWTDYPAPDVLLVAPPPLGDIRNPGAAETFAGGKEKSEALAGHYSAIADAAGVHFFDAGSVIGTDGVDGIHFTPENNETLGKALAREVERILSQ